jgi:hypothetical protein
MTDTTRLAALEAVAAAARETEWEADCEVCGTSYSWDKAEPPPLAGVFCPNCKDEKRRCVGVLNFTDADGNKPKEPGHASDV